MVARLVWDQDAAGSNPVTSTSPKTVKMAYLRRFSVFSFCPDSEFGHCLVIMAFENAAFRAF